MRWRANFFLQEKHEIDIRREVFRFKSKSTPSQCEHIEAFEKELLDMMIPNIKFRSVKDTFQKKLKEDIPKIKQSPNVFAFAEKTTNIYGCPNNNIKNFFMTTSPKHTKKHHLNEKHQ